MKKNKYLNKSIALFSAVLLSFSLLSCESEFKKDDPSPSSAPPVITSVSEAQEDVVVTQGVLGGTYIIRGSGLSGLKAVYFNGYKAGFNPALLTDNLAFVSVPTEAPYVNQENKLRLESLGGVTEYDFPLLTIESFTEETIDGVKIVNLIGGDFTDVTSVTFVSGTEAQGNRIEVPAKILNISQTVVTAEVPSGVTQAFIFVTTSRGASAQSESYGFSYSVYIDELNPDWSISEWGGTHDAASTEVSLGQFSVKSIREGWSGLTFMPSNADIAFSEYQAITVQIYGAGDIVSVNMALNDFDAIITLPLVSGKWTKFVIPLSDFYPNGGEPDDIFRIDFQESSNTGLAQYIFYVDDFGFL